MLYRGTSLTRGSGRAVVSATGTQTELGKIADLVSDAHEAPTPLERNLNTLAHKLIWVTLGITFTITLFGTLAGKDPALMIETGIALAVAAIPEGLPIVATIALARGMYRMAQKNALISRLASVETLGSTGVICTDKTGTLTENKMTVVRLLLPDEQYSTDDKSAGTSKHSPLQRESLSDAAKQALEIAVLCNNAEVVTPADTNDSATTAVFHGDPLEIALLSAGEQLGFHRTSLIASQPEVREEPFDSVTRMMATVHHTDNSYRVAVKGAPEEVIGVSTAVSIDGKSSPLNDDMRAHWIDENKRMASDGLRVIAVAEKTVSDETASVYDNLKLIGLIGFLDPPREDIHNAIKQCHEAGIQVVMITGDQTETAKYIGKNVSLLDNGDEVIHGSELAAGSELNADSDHLLKVRAFSRVSPQQKLQLIELHQKAGQIVAMTGDGVNDAPALKKADIGVAMGQRGTQVAREASDMVLQDDSFSTIVSAIREGRIIFSNIRLFALYLLSCNVSEVMIVGLAAIFGSALPLLPLQILFLNLVTDVFPALALGVGSGTRGMMSAKPRPSTEPLLGRREWKFIVFHGAIITLSVMSAFWLAQNWLELSSSAAVTVSFMTLALTQLWHVFNLRETGSNLFINQVSGNRFIWLALALCILIILIAFVVPEFSQVLSLQAISWQAWGLVAIASVAPLAIGQLTVYLRLPFAVKAAM